MWATSASARIASSRWQRAGQQARPGDAIPIRLAGRPSTALTGADFVDAALKEKRHAPGRISVPNPDRILSPGVVRVIVPALAARRRFDSRSRRWQECREPSRVSRCKWWRPATRSSHGDRDQPFGLDNE